ncbi:hypothetical protein PS712_00677 [Pseudomonas fluorescens]|uniref:Uncharacterized protein n=1 Tax=Pseudomonas fluorescens TaxID=294 RepID=A0A5E7AGL2_PSEFL|nr:hypothetical protein PS712_00677 [Pseudomonas fluorescens]
MILVLKFPLKVGWKKYYISLLLKIKVILAA